MTIDDAFDARLKRMFEEAAPPAEDRAYVESVMRRMEAPSRRRMLLIGGAAAGGSVIAATQLRPLFEHVRAAAEAAPALAADGAGAAARGVVDAAGVLAFVQPETLAAMTLALMAAMFAFFLPSRS